MHRTRCITALLLSGAMLSMGCERSPTSGAGDGHGASAPSGAEVGEAAPSNRVEIPATVRQNLGVTFAKVEYRNVARTLRLPGRFELLPTARREYRAPIPGRVELLVGQYQRVSAGTPLYSIDSAAWRDLHEQIAATQATVDSMGPLRDAHRMHEESLEQKVQLWNDRLEQLEKLREAGGGNAAQFTEARATLNATQADLAEVMEKDAELQAQQKQVEAHLRALQSRYEMLLRAGNCSGQQGRDAQDFAYQVCAVSDGVVELLGVTPGGLAEESGLVMTVVQPELIRFRARALQADLGRLRAGLPARIAPPQGGSVDMQDDMAGALQLGLNADADERTVDLIVQPDSLSNWARAGVSAYLEVTLEGGSEELAIPLSAVVNDGAAPIIFRRDPANADKAIRMEADLGLSDGRWVVIRSGVREGDEIVVGGNYQLMLATSGSAPKGGHFHSDGTFHEGEH